MLPLFSSHKASLLDKSLIEEYSLDESSLVTNAALGAFVTYKRIFENKRVLFLVGKGNNGSDALALASFVIPVAESVFIYNHFEKGNEENERRKREIDNKYFVSSPVDADVIVDGLFGVNYRLPLDERTRKVIDEVNGSSAIVIALDVPSAYEIRADYTITFMCQKKEMYLPQSRGKCGEITLFNPGFPKGAIKGGREFLLDDGDYNPKRFNLDDYKNTRGHVCVIGSSERYPGAAILTSLSSFHAGAGKVSLMSGTTTRNAVLSSCPSIMTQSETSPPVKADSYVVGPGWDEGRRDLLISVIESGKPFVVDADAIKLLYDLKLYNRAVITPHIGEFKKLLSILSIEESDVVESIKSAAEKLECVVVLKGAAVLISDGESLFVYDGANPSLGVAGSGDVLSGIAGAFLASGESPMESAVNAVILHQKCGRTLSEKKGFYTAEDIINEVGRER